MPAWVEATGMPVASANSARAASARLWRTPPPATTRGAAGGADQADGGGEFGRVGLGPPYRPGPLGEELLRPVVRLGLHVLRQGEGDRAGLDRVGEHPHRLQRRRDQRLRAGDPVEVPGDRAQAVVDGHVARVGHLQLLQHRVGGAGGEAVAGQQQHRQVVDGGQGGTGDQVGGAGPDGGGHRVRGEPVAVPGVADGRVHHGLLVAALVVRHHVGVLHQRLADPGDVAVAEDAPGGPDEPLPHAVPLGVLGGQEPHQRLRDRQPHRRGHRCPSVSSG
ncbi:hypothetical protein GCM10010389_15290 [Streptomyces echinoruber]|uniref:Uncharacterized protein n=1 Tax=Streptomyces echinoruber TaxID=68898 RepID=A0A918V7H0_9ACTN|nr:hypothetical protein GCM10010389_15290 [Streptomyces echinoruber]